MADEKNVSRRTLITQAGAVAAVAVGANAVLGADQQPYKTKQAQHSHDSEAHGIPQDKATLRKFQDRNKKENVACITMSFATDPWHVGDCEMRGLRLTVCSNGTGNFTSEVTTHHTVFGDVWHIHFDLKGINGLVLFTTRTFDSPTMHDDVFRPFNGDFLFPDYIYNSITSATAWSSC